jgi:hypothetical protein
VYCGDSNEHVDHIIPRSQGGNTDPENLQGTCAWCNQSKGAGDSPNLKYPDQQAEADGTPNINPEAGNAMFQEALSDGQIAAVSQPGIGEDAPAALFLPSEQSVGPEVWILDLDALI